jgi:P27 family predicted phage terminase small subunit
MGARGPASKPTLQVVREGNPGHKAMDELDRQVVLPPGAPDEPDWRTWFPAMSGRNSKDHQLARDLCRAQWRKLVPPLDAAGVLAEVDGQVLVDHCICWARIVLGERVISAEGFSSEGERGTVKNPAVTAVNQYRTQLRYTLVQLGLTPAARSRLTAREGGADGSEDAFD